MSALLIPTYEDMESALRVQFAEIMRLREEKALMERAMGEKFPPAVSDLADRLEAAQYGGDAPDVVKEAARVIRLFSVAAVGARAYIDSHIPGEYRTTGVMLLDAALSRAGVKP